MPRVSTVYFISSSIASTPQAATMGPKLKNHVACNAPWVFVRDLIKTLQAKEVEHVADQLGRDSIIHSNYREKASAWPASTDVRSCSRVGALHCWMMVHRSR